MGFYVCLYHPAGRAARRRGGVCGGSARSFWAIGSHRGLRDTPAALRRAIAGLPPRSCEPERPGKWSIGQVLQHLPIPRLPGLALSADSRAGPPDADGLRSDRWADRLGYADGDPEEALSCFECWRANLRLAERASPEDLARGRPQRARDESLEHQRRLYAGHDLLHRRQIDRIRTAVDV
jgi:hypothetical protein